MPITIENPTTEAIYAALQSVPASELARLREMLAPSVNRSTEWTDEDLSDSVVPRLSAATPSQLGRCQIGAGGRGLHWDDLDEDLSVASLMAMAGADGRSA